MIHVQHVAYQIIYSNLLQKMGMLVNYISMYINTGIIIATFF